MSPSRIATLSVLASLFGLARPAFAAPDNQACSAAAPIAFPSTTMGSTTDATATSDVSSCGTDDRYALWYSMVIPEDGRYVFTTAPTTGLTDTTIAVYDGCGGTTLDCSDDTPTDLRGAVTLDLHAGDPIRVRVAGWGSTRGDFAWTVSHPADLDRPLNDACADATPLAFSARVEATTLNATGADLSSCGATDSVDIWYAFTAPETRSYDFYLTGNLTSANIVSVYTDCGTGELSCGLGAASAKVQAGATVFVRVGTDPNVADTFNVNVGPKPTLPVPSNDTYDDPLPITVGQPATGTTAGATSDALYFGPACGPDVNAAVWYSFTAPTDGSYVFDTSASAMKETIVAVFDECHSGNGGPPAIFGCDDFLGVGRHGRMEGQLAAGQSVCIAVAGRYLSEDGDFTLSVTPTAGPPPNDRCEGALPLGFPDTVHTDNYAARSDGTNGVCPSGDFALWYSFTAPADGLYKFDTKETTETQPDLAIYDSCGGAQLGCSVDTNPAVWLSMTAGQEARVRVSTNVFIRSPIVLRVGPEPSAVPVGAGAGGATTSSTSGTSATMDASTTSGAGGAALGGGGSGSIVKDGTGCSCRASGPPSEASPWLALSIAVAGLAYARRTRAACGRAS